MHVRLLDHRAVEAGGHFVSATGEVRGRPVLEALLALDDGTLWRGETVGSHGPVAGRVRRLGDLVLVEGEMVAVLRNVRAVTFGARLETALPHDAEPGAQGFVTAAGATLPLHGRVARAIVRGDIGRP
jgi:hypothetical protein